MSARPDLAVALAAQFDLDTGVPQAAGVGLGFVA
jgi:hypothetical protein